MEGSCTIWWSCGHSDLDVFVHFIIIWTWGDEMNGMNIKDALWVGEKEEFMVMLLKYLRSEIEMGMFKNN